MHTVETKKKKEFPEAAAAKSSKDLEKYQAKLDQLESGNSAAGSAAAPAAGSDKTVSEKDLREDGELSDSDSDSE